MRIALIGYGKMGQLLEKRLLERKHEVIAVVDPFFKGKSGDTPSKAEIYNSLESSLKGAAGKSLGDADAAIEFTVPDSAPGNLLFLAGKKIPVVTGTTGWYGKLQEISAAVNNNGTSLVWSSNFSLGVNLFFRIAEYAAKLAGPFEEYDVGGFETHHNKKADSPSGTAKILVEKVLAKMPRKKKAVYETLDRPPAADELHYASLRVGSVPGTHSLLFDSAADSIEITHTARSREGFAAGAVLAAEWIGSKKRTGVFTVDDVLADILP